ncbi:MAG: alpha/beta fold hydrolase [Leptospirales bacterium]|jgi:pimeloyl-ACP methyl ester carboxylesterase
MRSKYFRYLFQRLAGGGLLCLAAVACGTAQPAQSDPAMTRSETALPLVFIPGLNGSLLEDSQGRQRWVSAAQGLALSTPDLSLPLQWVNGTQAADDLRPAGVIMDVSLISGVIGQDFYAPWVDFAREIPHRPLHIFSYDWRRDNNESSAKFEAFLDEISKRYGGKKVQVVSHSMGGMIALTALNRRPELFDRVVFAGVPFRGGIGYLDNMHLGIQIGLNGELLSPEVLFSHPSVYSFYPSGLPFENTDVLRDETGGPIRLDFYDAEVWRANGFGVFAPASAEWRGDAGERLNFLKAALRVAKIFRAAMEPRHSAAKYPPVLVVGSKSHKTIHHIQRKAARATDDGGESGPGESVWEFDATPREAGDGGVLFRDMVPPEPIQHTVALSEFEHAYLLNDPTMQERVARFLQESSAK